MLRRIWLLLCGMWAGLMFLNLLGTGFEGKNWYLIAVVGALPWVVSFLVPFLARYIVFGDARRRRPIAPYSTRF
jgi:hypothetical protein